MARTQGSRHGPLDHRRHAAAVLALAVAILAFLAFARTAYATVVSGPTVVVSLDTSSMAAEPAWAPLPTIVFSEVATDDLPPSQTEVTLILRAPLGWEFREGFGQVLASVFPGDITSDSIVVTASHIAVTLSTDDQSDAFDVILIPGIEVRPTTTTPTTGTIYRPAGAEGGTAVLSGITASPNADGAGGTSFGSLTSVVGVPVTLSVQTLNANSDAGSATTALTAGEPFAVRLLALDQFGNLTTAGGDATVAFATTAGGAADGTTPTIPAAVASSFASGMATVADFVLTNAEAGVTVSASVSEPGASGIVPGAAGTSAAANISPGPVADFVVEANGGGPIGSVPAWTPFAIQITARDAHQNPAVSGPNNFSGSGNSVDLTANVAGVAGLGTTPSFVDGMLVNHSVTLGEPSAAAILRATRSGGPDTTTGTSSLFVVEGGDPPILSVPSELTVIAEAAAGTDVPDRLGLIVAFLGMATATDAVDGSSLPVANDAPSFMPVGTTAVEFSAVDDRGTSSAATVAVHVIRLPDALATLDQQVVALDLESGLEWRLRYRLRRAGWSVEHEDWERAWKYMQSFIRNVQYESGSGISPSDAVVLEGVAERICDVLSLRMEDH